MNRKILQNQTHSLPDARPHSDRFRCGGRESEFLAETTSTLMLAKGALHAMFIAKVKTVSLTAAACLVVAGTGVVTAKQLAGSSMQAPVQPTVTALSVAPVPTPTAALPDAASTMAETQPVQPHVQPSQNITPTEKSPSPAAPVTQTSRGRIAAIEKDQLTLHVLRGHSGIMQPVALTAETEVWLAGGQRGTLADLKVDQWVQVTLTADWKMALKIEPSTPPYPLTPRRPSPF